MDTVHHHWCFYNHPCWVEKDLAHLTKQWILVQQGLQVTPELLQPCLFNVELVIKSHPQDCQQRVNSSSAFGKAY